ncbi:MAG: transcription antitermination factor NusB [Planctomycetota bacterium]|nr:transcription antitermination factor NusB [Planctomycetota bacterium]
MTARATAYAALADRVSVFPELHRRAIDREGITERDARLANAIDHQATLRWLTLQATIEPHLRQSWTGLKPVVRAALLGGSAQLLLMDRIPDHAVLNETVDWIKSGSQPRAAGLVNAVLRRICDLRKGRIEQVDPDRPDVVLRSDGSGIELTKPIFDQDPIKRLEQQTSCPAALIEHWRNAFDPVEARRLALHGIAEAPLVVSDSDCDELGNLTDPHELPGFRVVRAGHGIQEVLKACPDTVVQDPASADPIRATIGLDAHCILDLCAGRGTKTRLLSRHHSESRIITTDIDRKLIADLTASTAACPNVTVRPFGQFDDLLGQVDLLVLDVPCSNTAVLARRPEARNRFTSEALAELADRQRQIIADSLPLLSPSGRILYATCSLDPKENQEQAQWLIRWHHFRIESERLLPPQGLPGDPATKYHDGSYHALLCR